MRRVILFSLLLVAGLVVSQILPAAGPISARVADWAQTLAMVGLAFIMIHVGLEFDLDKAHPRRYLWDGLFAMGAAGLPWILVTAYFLLFVMPPGSLGDSEAWTSTLLVGRFAAPTSAGILFAMLAAAGLGASWVFRKARVLAVLDDLDTILFMIPLQMLMVGLAWQLGLVFVILGVQLWLAWRYLNRLVLPVTWPWVLSYAVGIVIVTQVIHAAGMIMDDSVPVHLEVLLPSFVLGCVLRPPALRAAARPHRAHLEGPGTPSEHRAATIVSASFMALVGLSLPPFLGADAGSDGSQPGMELGTVAFHVVMVTLLSNVGKLFLVFCYRRETGWRDRLALGVAMCPRGEVGCGVLLISMTFGVSGQLITIGFLSLAVNLVLTGVFIVIVRSLIGPQGAPEPTAEIGALAGKGATQ